LKKPFYGWIIVGVCFLIGVTEVGVFQNILSIFMKPMAREFGWSRAAVTGAIAVGSISGGLISPLIGPVLDRYGSRMVAFWGIVFFSIGVFALMFIRHIWQLYLFFGAGRMIAVGMLNLVISVSVSNWFVRQRGRALGITRIGERIGSALLPPIIQFLILAYGWRTSWGVLGVVVFLLSGIPSILFLRRRPEDMGLLPDNAPPAAKNIQIDAPAEAHAWGKPLAALTEPVWTRAQAIRTRTFWTLTFLTCLIPFVQAGINFHIYPFLTDRGLNEQTAVGVISTIAVFGALGSISWGMMAERVRVQTLMAANLFGNSLIFLLIYWTVRFKTAGAFGIGLIFVLAALHGLLHGGRNTLISVIWAVFFGRSALGSIYSYSIPFRSVANACGPVFAALCFDLFGSYAVPFYLFAALFFLSGLISLRMQPPDLPA